VDEQFHVAALHRLDYEFCMRFHEFTARFD
jgi:hypothetical protein